MDGVKAGTRENGFDSFFMRDISLDSNFGSDGAEVHKDSPNTQTIQPILDKSWYFVDYAGLLSNRWRALYCQ